MRKVFNPAYRKDYFEGYSRGFDPYLQVEQKELSEAFSYGFNLGRLDYEQMNGSIINGIPQLIVTNKILEEFLLAGLLGMAIDSEGYTDYQIDVINKWYQSGIEKYDPDSSDYLLLILLKRGIHFT
jgi:hypothetical protein